MSDCFSKSIQVEIDGKKYQGQQEIYKDKQVISFRTLSESMSRHPHEEVEFRDAFAQIILHKLVLQAFPHLVAQEQDTPSKS